MAIFLAFKFLTVLPIPLGDDAPPEEMGRAVAFYPLVGLVLGLALAGADYLLGLALPLALRSALVLGLWVGLTGALHLDGFLDCCDALLPPRPAERRLEILRDVHAGSFAVVGAVLLLLVKYAALASLLGPVRLLALIGVPVLGRWAIAYAVVAYPYARASGLGRLVKEGAGWRELLVATILAAGALLAAWRLPGLAALPLTWAFVAFLVLWIMARIPGLTGDAYGFIDEMVEVLWLVGIVATAGIHL